MTLKESQTVCDKACDILGRTRDGNDLAPRHLKLVELAVNDMLTDAGKCAFAELYQSVLNGYKKPWHFGVEHVTKDLAGFVYWKGVQVEHFTYRGDYKAEQAATERLAAACRHLEAIDRPISFDNYFNALNEIDAQQKDQNAKEEI